jgi:hypothetical protein
MHMLRLRVEYERIVELSEKRIELDLHFGNLGINLAGRSKTEVRREADRWAEICKCPELATDRDREFIDAAGSVQELTLEWASAATEFDSFVAKAKLEATQKNKMREGIRSEMELAGQVVCLAEAGRWSDALITASRLPYWEWRRLIRMIKQSHHARQMKARQLRPG